ncbi:MAG: 4-hydroxy-tetrahydrodipicolinate synthase [Propionibacteriaceae bacterium]|jgi:4-hydroxy-tetrahydrodipicolinate synthase|nr:4-hydroxy-tetrahydrodipicolinate synthase [Propionibacteriaceae bacterium]
MANPVFGRVLTAMVTPFNADGSVDYRAARALARYLIDVQGNDALVLNGTTGEAPTTTEPEKQELIRQVRAELGDAVPLVAGTGYNDTIETVKLSQDCIRAGADGLLVVTPYYSRPPQEGVYRHFMTVADAVDKPIIIYDIPKRAGIEVAEPTLIRLSTHDRIVGVKDAKGDLASTANVIKQTDLAYYSGDDPLTLPLLSIGAVGVIGTSTHFSGQGTKAMIEAFLAGNPEKALEWHRRMLPVFTGVFATQGAMMVKGTLARRGQIQPGLRGPLVEADPALIDTFLDTLASLGL